MKALFILLLTAQLTGCALSLGGNVYTVGISGYSTTTVQSTSPAYAAAVLGLHEVLYSGVAKTTDTAGQIQVSEVGKSGGKTKTKSEVEGYHSVTY
jgi:hypothetical protein